MGFIVLATMGIAISVIRLRELPMRPRRLIDIDAFKYKMYGFYCASQFFTFAGVFIPFFYVQQYSREMANTSANLAFYTLTVMNAGSIFGRVIPGLVADQIGTMNTLIICGPMTLTLAFSWLAIHDTVGILIFSGLYGFASGGFLSLQSATVAHMCPKLDRVGTWLGMVAFSSGLGILIGNPAAGAILANGSWAGIQCFTGAFSMIGVVFILAARWAKSGIQVMIKS